MTSHPEPEGASSVIETARYLRRYLTPHVGRMSPAQLRHVGEHLHPPAYFAVGPFLLLIEIPERFRKQDRVPSLEEINAAVRAAVEQIKAGFSAPGT